MRTLSILRHAKSSWANLSLDDFERQLAKRGATAASDMGRYMARENLRPDLILCSGATRARATVALVLAELGPPPEVIVEDALYLALPIALVERVRRIGDETWHTLIVGHNPGLHALALDLAGEGERRDIAALGRKFPTAALAVLTFPADSWSAIESGSGRLTRFVTPRGLGNRQ